MADVRSMLRAERANRRITHPHASYTGDGKLLCNLCETIVKTEAQWQGHLHSTQHNLRSQRKKDAATSRPVLVDEQVPMKKKRKADEIDSSPVDERKKAKAVDFDLPPKQTPEQTSTEQGHVDEETSSPLRATSTFSTSRVPVSKQQEIDEDVAALEREIDELRKANGDVSLQLPLSALSAEATIAVAPITAAELASQAREEQSQQRSKREIELEGEREDAARVLEEEFEEMENFEERVRKLRERREELRTVEPGIDTKEDEDAGRSEGAVDEEEDDSDYEDADWQFGAG